MAIRLIYEAPIEKWAPIIRAAEKPVADAAFAAMKETAATVKAESKKEFASARLGRLGQSAMRSKLDPKKPSIDASVEFFLKPAFLNVFEIGSVIVGSPLIWLPTDNVPLGDRSHPLTPAQYIARIGPLSGSRRGGRPILFGRGSRASIIRARRNVVRLRKRAVAAGTIIGEAVPMFVGVPLVQITKRIDLTGIIKRAGDRIGQVYERNFKPPKD